MNDSSSPSNDTASAAEWARAHRLLAWQSALFLALCWWYVPRLNNNVIGDREFTGWVGPIAERFVAGEIPYVDFVFPIPPGSFVLLALVQQLTGQAILIQELWAASICHLLMAWLAYAIAAQLSSPRTAIFVAAGSLITAMQLPKECLYDHTSQLCAWASVTTGLYAFRSEPAKSARWWLSAGFLTSATLIFKQSTAVGIGAGWLFGLAYLIFVDTYRLRQDIGAPLGAAVGQAFGWRRTDVKHFSYGLGLGVALLWALLWSLDSGMGPFIQAVFSDASGLKGGKLPLLLNVLSYLFNFDAYRGSLLFLGLMIYAGFRSSRAQPLSLNKECEDPGDLTVAAAWLIATVLFCTFGAAILLLAANISSIPPIILAGTEGLRLLPAFGLGFGCLFLVVHLFYARQLPPSGPSERHRAGGLGDRGHVFVAVGLTAMVCSLIYNTSFVRFYPFYYNNPNIPFAFLALHLIISRTRLPGAAFGIFALSLLPLFSIKMNRALGAQTPVLGGHWMGLQVNERGAEMLRAARTVQSLAAADETVLVLPEDVQLVGLFNRPRPTIRGAVLFVDQYAARLLSDDLLALRRDLPKVVVVHPNERVLWERVFSTWSVDSATHRVMYEFLFKLLPQHYERKASFRSVYFWRQGTMDIWVRKSSGPSKESP